jgi:alpha-galactosidase
VFECGRFDDEMLNHASQEWAEDYADALDRRDEAKRERAWMGDY